MSKFPGMVRVVGKDYTMGLGEDVFGDNFGVHNAKQCHMTISNDLSPEQERDTVIHECLHALDEAVALNLNEKTVHALAGVLYAWMKENPKLIEYIMEL